MSERKCPNCGAVVLPTDQHCPNCGKGLAEGGNWRSVGKAASLLIFILIGVPAGLLGGCGVVLTVLDRGNDPLMFLVALGALGIGAASLYWMVTTWKK